MRSNIVFASTSIVDIQKPKPKPYLCRGCPWSSEPQESVWWGRCSSRSSSRSSRSRARGRWISSFDGAYEQIEAVLSSDIAEWCVEHNIGLFKWAAACSLVQQPNDVSRCHKILHRLFASSKYLYAPVKKENIRTCMFPVIAMLNSLPKLACACLTVTN